VLAPLASERKARIVVGTNTDDLSDHRPGLRAAVERGIESPLVAAGLTKAEVRGLSRDLGLPTAEKPSSPCLASRVAYGVRVTPERLRRIEKAEASVRALGFACVRVRDHGAAASVEVGHDEVATALAQQETIVAKLNSFGYQDVSVDPRGYRMGSLNDLLIAAAPNH
jgi:uncharacterized protein